MSGAESEREMVKRAADMKEGNKKRKREPLALNRGAWTAKEDQKLVEYIANHGDKNWKTLPAKAGLISFISISS